MQVNRQDFDFPGLSGRAWTLKNLVIYLAFGFPGLWGRAWTLKIYVIYEDLGFPPGSWGEPGPLEAPCTKN